MFTMLQSKSIECYMTGISTSPEARIVYSKTVGEWVPKACLGGTQGQGQGDS